MAEPQTDTPRAAVRNFKFQVDADRTSRGQRLRRDGLHVRRGHRHEHRHGRLPRGWVEHQPAQAPGADRLRPLTMSTGVFYNKPQMWNLAKKMFAVQTGAAARSAFTDGEITQFRYDMVGAGPRPPGDRWARRRVNRRSYDGAVLAFKFYNCWTASVGFNGLNAQDNDILIHQMRSTTRASRCSSATPRPSLTHAWTGRAPPVRGVVLT